MKRLPFDDPGAFRRRWSHLTPSELHDHSLLDPLLFAADHLPIEDRHEGTVLVVAELEDTPAPVVVVIPDGPAAPPEETCLGMLSGIIARLDEAVAELDFLDDECRDPDFLDTGEATAVRRIGVVTHRLGSASVSDLDMRWMRALGLVSVALGIDTIGVITRTRGGAIVRVPEPAAA